MNQKAFNPETRLAFIGGGNMASAIIGGLLARDLPAAHIAVLDPSEASCERLRKQGIQAQAQPGPFLAQADLLVWAVKPQQFRRAAGQVRSFLGQNAQLSIMAGIRLTDLVAASGCAQMIRCIPNTPALIGQGMTAMYAAPEVRPAARELANAVMRCAGQTLWVDREKLIDAATALSGSGPAYVFYFLEAMEQAGVEMGLTAEQARQLAMQTFAGGAALASRSDEPLATLRERVTSKGGTTFAALQQLESAGVKTSFVQAMHAARIRAAELADEFGQ